MAGKMRELQERKKAEQRAKVTQYQPGDKVWVRTVNSRMIKWVSGVVECVVSSVFYEVQVSGRVRQISSSHLRHRSAGATRMEDDPRAIEVPVPPPPETPAVPLIPPTGPPPEVPVERPPPLSIPRVSASPAPPSPVEAPPSPVPVSLSPGLAQPPSTLGGKPPPTPRVPVAPTNQGASASRPPAGPSQAVGPSSTPARASVTTRVGRRVVQPSRFKDFVRKQRFPP